MTFTNSRDAVTEARKYYDSLLQETGNNVYSWEKLLHLYGG